MSDDRALFQPLGPQTPYSIFQYLSSSVVATALSYYIIPRGGIAVTWVAANASLQGKQIICINTFEWCSESIQHIIY